MRLDGATTTRPAACGDPAYHRPIRLRVVASCHEAVGCAAWVARFDRVREEFVGAYPGRDQLRFVCHRANQRMAKAIPLSRNELRLIDQLGGYQVGQTAGLDLR